MASQNPTQIDLLTAKTNAEIADDNWQATLDAERIERYSMEAKSGSVLRDLYQAKLDADARYAAVCEAYRIRY